MITTIGRTVKWTMRRTYGKAFNRYGITSPIVVHHMARVGSTAVFEALERLGLNVPVYHTHMLDGLDQHEIKIRETKKDPAYLALLEYYRKIRHYYDHSNVGPWNLVSLIRD